MPPLTMSSGGAHRALNSDSWAAGPSGRGKIRAETMDTAPRKATWESGKFELIPEQRTLLADGIPVPLTSKAFDTLVLLVEHRDRVVTKDEILRVVWPDVVVEEGNLTQQIFLLRKALGESAQQPRYIVTVPGHGYRFAGPVDQSPHPPADTVASAAGGSARDQAKPRTRRPISMGIFISAVLALAAIVLAMQWSVLTSRRPWLDPATVRITKVTESGKAINSAISPDGRVIAYTENEGDEYSLWVQQIGAAGATQVVPRQREMLIYLRFSPDGQFLYFTRGVLSRGGFVLHRVPVIGGRETPVLDDVDTAISFSPDGRQFVFMRGAGRETRIVVASSDGSAQRILASRTRPLAFSFVAPSWSPDGRMISATVTDQSKGGRSSIVLIPIDGGSSRELYSSDSLIGTVQWLPDGSGLLTIVSETLARQFAPWQSGTFLHISGGPIWRIAYPSGRAERLTTDLAEYDVCCLDISADGRTIGGVVNSLVSDLWIAQSGRLDAPRQLTWGTPVVTRHDWLPDNDAIVYRDLSGRLNTVRTDGRVFSLQVPEGYKVARGVSACGDGRYIVFQAAPGKNLWRVMANAGGATQLTYGLVDSNPVCSPDGKWVWYSSLKDGVVSTYRIAIEGGDPSQVIAGESFEPLPSHTGRLIFYSAFEWEEHPVRLRRLRWIVVSSDNLARLFTFDVPGDATAGPLNDWAPDESGLDYVVTRNGVSNIWRQPLTGGSPVQITHFNSGKIFGFAWSADGRWLSLAAGASRSDVVLISREP